MRSVRSTETLTAPSSAMLKYVMAGAQITGRERASDRARAGRHKRER